MDFIQQTSGGQRGYWVRRCIHVAMLFIPILYFSYIDALTSFFHISSFFFLLIIFVLIILIELWRLSANKIFFGQRTHERKQISSSAWGAAAIIVVLLFAPEPGYAVAIIASCALADPLLGELRRHHYSNVMTWILGIILVALIWLVCARIYNFPYWIGYLMAPITVFAEWPKWRWIDDNALMQLVPLMICLFVG